MSSQARKAVLSEPGSRYIDFLMPGLMGMNLLGGGIWIILGILDRFILPFLLG